MNDVPTFSSDRFAKFILSVISRHYGDSAPDDVDDLESAIHQPQAQINVLRYQYTHDILANNPVIPNIIGIDR